MSKRLSVVQRVLGVALAWGALWLAFGLALGGVVGILDPDSIDPGDLEGLVTVMGSIGLLSGLAFGIIGSIAGGGAALSDLSFTKAVLWGVIGTAIVQLGYLGHGDAGLAANVQMALVFCGFGGVIAVTWLLLARQWSRRRSEKRA